jgi:hypothetical protein
LPPSSRQPTLWRGAYHVHTTQSDGSGTPEQVAAAASRAGLDFVILTDHGDATGTPTPPRFVSGVLMIDATEISTDDGHYVALGLSRSPYPLAGEGRAVVDDVRRLGGVGILAHPDSPRGALAWHDMSADADGFEWINADTAWRTARVPQVLSRLLSYPLARAGTLASLARYPARLFAERDLAGRRPQLALAAVDAHARIGWQRDLDPIDGGRTLASFPSYPASFGTFGLVVPWLNRAPSGEAATDAGAVLAAIRDRVAYSAVFSMASPVWLSLEIAGAGTTVPSPDASGAATLMVRGNAPAGATVRLVQNGATRRDLMPGDVSLPLAANQAAAIYRVEVWLPARRGWPELPVALSAARGHNLPDLSPNGPREVETGAAIRGWHVEHDAASGALLRVGETDAVAAAELTLASGARVSQFAALVGDVAAPSAEVTGLSLELSASAPMRVSVQLREPRAGDGLRWRHSAYVDDSRRRVHFPVAAFRAIRPASGLPALDRVHAVLLVMDTVNARPGDRRTLTVHAARWTRDR